MKYLRQFCVILSFTLLGEALQRLVPLPSPAAVYGLLLLFAALCCGWVQQKQVEDVGSYLLTVMPELLVDPPVNILEHWKLIASQLASICLLIAASTVLTFVLSGRMTQFLMKRKGGHDAK